MKWRRLHLFHRASSSRNGISLSRGGGGVRSGVTPYIKVYGDVPQVWVMFFHLLVFIRVINLRFYVFWGDYYLPVVCLYLLRS